MVEKKNVNLRKCLRDGDVTREHVVSQMFWSLSVFPSISAAEIQLRNPSYFIWSTEKNKSGRQPMAKESQRQKRLASPVLALNQSKTACQVTAGEEAALSSMMTQLGARCRAAET